MKIKNLRTKETNSKGITLISLIVTIIILLILATVSIQVLTGDNGLLTMSKSAVDKNSDGEIEEQIKLAYQEYQTEKFTGTDKTELEYIKESLEKIYGNGKVTISVEDEVYHVVIDINGKEKKYYLDNGKFGIYKDLNDYGVKIGDIVYYDATKDKNGNTLSTTYTSYSLSDTNIQNNSGRTSGYNKNQTFSVNTNTNGWRVLNISKNGELELISNDPIQTSNNEDYYLSGEYGYLNGVEELNAICSIFGQGKGAVGARSLCVKDIDRLAGITEETKKVLNSNYGTIWTYRFPKDGDYMQYRKQNENGQMLKDWTNIEDYRYQTYREPGSSNAISSNNRIESSNIKYSFYGYTIENYINNTKISDLISKGISDNNVSQWLATNYRSCNGESTYFWMHAIINGKVANRDLYYSNNINGNNGVKVRPVVIISTNTVLNGNSEEGWTIN